MTKLNFSTTSSLLNSLEFASDYSTVSAVFKSSPEMVYVYDLSEADSPIDLANEAMVILATEGSIGSWFLKTIKANFPFEKIPYNEVKSEKEKIFDEIMSVRAQIKELHARENELTSLLKEILLKEWLES